MMWNVNIVIGMRIAIGSRKSPDNLLDDRSESVPILGGNQISWCISDAAGMIRGECHALECEIASGNVLEFANKVMLVTEGDTLTRGTVTTIHKFRNRPSSSQRCRYLSVESHLRAGMCTRNCTYCLCGLLDK